MSAAHFEPALEIVLKHEGAVIGGDPGYVNDPDDPGGATVAGVSLRAVVGLRNVAGELEFDVDGDGDVDATDMQLVADAWRRGHTEKIATFYRERYWNAIKGDELPWPNNLMLFDSAIHHGPRQAIVLAQKAAFIPADGILGMQSLKAFSRRNLTMLQRQLVKRSELFRDICLKRGWKFYAGWMHRLFSLHSEALRRV